MAKEIKDWMWGNTISFLEETNCEDVADVCWQYNNDGAVEKIEIVFEHPIYVTAQNES